MKSVISIGNQDFISIRKNNCFYIDKTDFIREWWDNQDSVTLITRPRRFGKTLNMSMVEYFFSVNHSECSKYFEDLVIWKEERFRKLQGTYPVISLSFADIKATTYETARRAVIRKLVKLYSTFEFVKSSKVLNEKDRAYFDSVEENMSDDAAAVAVNYLSDYLSRYYGKKVIILLDEYDTPLQESYIHGYWENLTAFIRSLFNSTFKTNPYMERGLLTGITRVSKESIFSDLNNLEVVTTTSEKYSGSFGFTEEEVFHALEENGLSDCLRKQDVAIYLKIQGFPGKEKIEMSKENGYVLHLDVSKFFSGWDAISEPQKENFRRALKAMDEYRSTVDTLEVLTGSDRLVKIIESGSGDYAVRKERMEKLIDAIRSGADFSRCETLEAITATATTTLSFVQVTFDDFAKWEKEQIAKAYKVRPSEVNLKRTIPGTAVQRAEIPKMNLKIDFAVYVRMEDRTQGTLAVIKEY